MKSRVVVLLPVKIGANEKIMVTLWFGCIWEIVTKRFPVRPRGHREIPTAVDSPDHERSFYKL
jgi:hypothetical protein